MSTSHRDIHCSLEGKECVIIGWEEHAYLEGVKVTAGIHIPSLHGINPIPSYDVTVSGVCTMQTQMGRFRAVYARDRPIRRLPVKSA